MDLEEIRSDLEDRFPQWADRIGLLRFQRSDSAAPVFNDGRTIYYNPSRLNRYSRESRLFYMAQQLMHIQLAHAARRGSRDAALWKRSTDAVVNAMLRDDGLQPPEDVFLVREAASMSAEELYKIYLERADRDTPPDAEPEFELNEAALSQESKKAGGESTAQQRELEEAGIAAAVAGLADMLQPSMQLDFDWFAGRTIRDGMLRYEFRAYPVAQAEILLDTSASVDAHLLRRFVRGVKALLREDAIIRVGCFDTRFYGFQDVHTEEDIENLELQGSGGTDFTVAINAFTGDAENQIIFTDGYAEMPEQNCSAVWVVYGSTPIHPRGGRVIYVKPHEEKEKHEVDFLIT